MEESIKKATAQFEAVLRKQLARIEEMKKNADFVDYKSLDKIIIGVCGGDGIGPVITKECARVLEFLLKDKVLYLSFNSFIALCF